VSLQSNSNFVHHCDRAQQKYEVLYDRFDVGGEASVAGTSYLQLVFHQNLESLIG